MVWTDPEGFLCVGPPGDELCKLGKCRVCGIPIFGKERVRLDICPGDECIQEERRRLNAAAE